MELQQIKQFREIARTENISKAAEALGLTQATLSQNLKRLEDELGVQLFERVGKKLIINNAGEIMYHHCDEICTTIDILALKYTPTNPIYHRDYAITLARLGDTKAAKEELQKAELLHLDDASINLLNGEIYYAEKQYALAVGCFSEVVSGSDDEYMRYRAYHSIDEIYKIQGDLQASIDLLEDCMNKIPLIWLLQSIIIATIIL
ncbi:MAG: LysR family transcriptional regulator [Oscillospiraceae bacterium]|nr:LysR family transcriptional regulator [Oscillospiraceae bacterium]